MFRFGKKLAGNMRLSEAIYSIPILHRPLGHLLAWYMRLLGRTCDFEIEGQEHYNEAVASERPVLCVLWHQQLMPFISFSSRALDLSRFVLIVEDGNRGSILSEASRVMKVHDTVKINMEDCSFASGNRLRAIIRHLQQGRYMLTTPDGPYGPAFVAKSGTAFIAQKVEAAIVPCGAWTRQAYQLRRWDRYIFPFPFGHIAIVFREPMFLARQSSDDSAESRLGVELTSARNRAQVIAGEVVQ